MLKGGSSLTVDSVKFRYDPAILFVEMRFPEDSSAPAADMMYPALKKWYEWDPRRVGSRI